MVRYSDGTREIRKRSDSAMASMQAAGQEMPSVQALSAAFEQRPEVLYAEPIVLYHIADGEVNAAAPTDPLYVAGQLWGFDAIHAGYPFGQFTTPSMASVVVAVIDSGVNSSHPDLDEAMYKVGGVVRGYDFVDNDAVAQDGHGHGTHVAGTIAAEANGIDIVGIAAGVSIMPVRVLDNSGSGNNVALANGILWAKNNGASVINLSLGAAQTAQR